MRDDHMESTKGQKMEIRLEFPNRQRYMVNVLCETFPKGVRTKTYSPQIENW